MKSNIAIIFGNDIAPVTYGKFPAGEIYLKSVPKLPEKGEVEVLCLIEDMDGFFALALLADHLRRENMEVKLHLHMGYIPFARQDRAKVGVPGNGCLSMAVSANFINSMNWDSVTLYDPHSEVAPALIQRVRKVHSRAQSLEQQMSRILYDTDPSEIVVISPDAGALKHSYDFCKHYGLNDVVVAEKQRDMATGQILKTVVHDSIKLNNKVALIVDDICDGGRTFTEIYDAVKSYNIEPTKFILLTTVGIYSKGKKVLTDKFDVVECAFQFETYKELDNV